MNDVNIDLLTKVGGGASLTGITIAWLKGWIITKASHQEVVAQLVARLQDANEATRQANETARIERENGEKWKSKCLQAWGKIDDAAQTTSAAVSLAEQVTK